VIPALLHKKLTSPTRSPFASCRWAFAEITHRMKEFHAVCAKGAAECWPARGITPFYKKLYLTAVYILRI
jgi:hypothetical protein